MPLVIVNEPIALEMAADGVWRVGGTRVTLDTVVAAFNEGATAEEIAQQYPSLKLADVYSVIGYYLRRRQEVDDYLTERQRASERCAPGERTSASPARACASGCWPDAALKGLRDHAPPGCRRKPE